MAKVHFAPNSAIKYVGSKAKVFDTSLARPKPTIKKGDIIIVDKRTAFNLTHKGFGDFKEVDSIEFVKSDVHTAETISKLKEELGVALKSLASDEDSEELKAYKTQNNELFAKNVELTKELTALKAGDSETTTDSDTSSGDGE